jgi:hypothetical protein
LTLEKSSHVAIDVSWGIAGIDTTERNDVFTAGVPIYDLAFNMTDPKAQIFMRDVCKGFGNQTSNLLTFPSGKDWVCPFEMFDNWLQYTYGVSGGLPLGKDELVVKLKRYFEYGYVRIGNVKVSTYKQKEFVGFNMETGEIDWMRIAVDTIIDVTVDATSGEKISKQWNAYIKELDEDAPASVGGATMSSFLWVRITTELLLIRSTISAWAISNISAFVAILFFTRSLYIAVMTTLTIFFIVVTLLWFMVYVMKWPMGAMEALSVTIFVGMACDYCLHIAHSFIHSKAPTKKLRARQSLTMVGNSVLGAAITTIASSVFLLLCSIVFFYKMGVVIALNTICSLFFALVFFPALLTITEKDERRKAPVITFDQLGQSGVPNNELSNANFGGSFLGSEQEEEEDYGREERGGDDSEEEEELGVGGKGCGPAGRGAVLEDEEFAEFDDGQGVEMRANPMSNVRHKSSF